MNPPEHERALLSILRTLEGYREDVVLVGGWVPYLHLEYGRASEGTGRTSLTTEADIVVPASLAREGRRPLRDMLTEAGFRPRGASRVVWSREAKRGETIEFLQQHQGPAGSRGEPRGVEEQPGLRALCLTHLWPLQTFTEELEVHGTTVRVPTLSAFVLNKANTFNLRRGENRKLKAGKDLLYLRDVVASGPYAEKLVAQGLDDMLEDGRGERVAEAIRRAVVHLDKVADRFHSSAAEILAERDQVSRIDAIADVRGHLRDVREILDARL